MSLLIYLRNRNWEKALSITKKTNFWWYNKNINHKNILLRYDDFHGAGDIFQYIRYAQHLHNAGAIVFIQTRQALIPILSQCPFITRIIPHESSTPEVDEMFENTPVIYMARDANKHPDSFPYLSAKPELITFWKNKLASDKNFKIGLCWRTTPIKIAENKYIDNPRTINWTQLASLAQIPGISLYSLQVPPLDNEIIQGQTPIRVFNNIDTTHGQFMDTAALIMNLDLVISIDTSVAHLAGALGRPVWTMLPHGACWRWFCDDSDSLWYPTMKLFRQPKRGDWKSVIETIVSQLKYQMAHKACAVVASNA